MEHSRLPIEVCELIIDVSAYSWYGSRGELVEIATLRACALTCRAWRPRSLINLYHTIILNDDVRTRDVVRSLRKRDDCIAINVRVINTFIIMDSMGEQGYTPPRYHCVPYLLAGLPQAIRNIQTVSIRGRSAMHYGPVVLGRPTHSSDIFLQSYSYFQSVQTLKLADIKFHTLSYFARFITCFRGLRHLHLDMVKFTKLDDYPSGPAKLKQCKLRTLAIIEVKPPAFCHVARWLLKADVLSLLESLSCHDSEGSTPGLAGCISDMMATAGSSLKHLKLMNFSSSTMDCSPNTSLRSIHLQYFKANSAASIFSTISSRDVSAVKLERIEANGIADVDALAAILLSNQFTSLPKLNSVYVQITPAEKWKDHLVGKVAVRKQVAGSEIDGSFRNLRGVFGERLETAIDWWRWPQR